MKRINAINVTDCETLKVIQIHENLLSDDVLDRFLNMESFVDTDNELKEKLISVDRIGAIVTNEDDDTNTCTKEKIEVLYEKIKEFDYLMITTI
jgi:hypothetical protein